jgi:amidase
VSDELAWLDATATAGLIRDGAVSAREVTEAALTRLHTRNHALNAVIGTFDDAVDRASVATGPFAGVPMLSKDLWGAHLAGWPRAMGNRVLAEAEVRVEADERLAGRFRDAGLVSLGRTNTPEFGLQPTTQPIAFGATHNPWDVRRSTAGSSGGAAAAVAAGIVPIAHGSDSGGSIRLPAGWCGVVGLKPSRGRISYAPGWTNRLSAGHALTRSVRDTAAILDATAGNLPGDLFWAPGPARPYRDEVGADPGRLRVGFVAESPAGVAPECVVAVESTVRLLEDLGHHVEHAWPEALWAPDGGRAGGLLFRSLVGGFARPLRALLDREIEPGDVEPFTWAMAFGGPPPTVDELALAHDAEQARAGTISSWWSNGHDDGFDLLVTPTAGVPPQLLTDLAPPPDDPLSVIGAFLPIIAFAGVFNLTGQPAISLPLHSTDDRLPVGVQLVAGFGREDVLVRVASQLEAARPWADRHPGSPTHAS